MTRSIQDDLLKVTSSIANIRQMQSECEVQEKNLERNVQINTNEREKARRKIRAVTEIQTIGITRIDNEM